MKLLTDKQRTARYYIIYLAEVVMYLANDGSCSRLRTDETSCYNLHYHTV